MREPWAHDWVPEPDALAARLEAELPRFAPARVDATLQGWDFYAFDLRDGTGARWIARVPKRRDTARAFELERAVLARLEGRLPVPIPSYLHVLAPGDGLRYACGLYRRLPGVPLVERIAALHAAPLEGPFPPSAWEGGGREPLERVLARHAVEWESALPPTLRTATLRALEATRPRDAGHTVPLHSDFHPEHLLVDPETSRLTGVIDWGDVEPGDPAADFAALLAWGGRALVDPALDAYGADAALRARVPHHAIAYAAGETVAALTGHAQAGVEACRAMLERLLRDAGPGPAAPRRLRTGAAP